MDIVPNSVQLANVINIKGTVHKNVMSTFFLYEIHINCLYLTIFAHISYFHHKLYFIVKSLWRALQLCATPPCLAGKRGLLSRAYHHFDFAYYNFCYKVEGGEVTGPLRF